MCIDDGYGATLPGGKTDVKGVDVYLKQPRLKTQFLKLL
jgi:hypothetical protein